MAGRVNELPTRVLNAEQRTAITEAFAGYLLGCFPLGQDTPEQATWAFDCPLLPTFKQWMAVALDDATRAEHQGLITLGDGLANSEQRCDALKGLSTVEEPVQTLLAHLFHVLAHTSAADAEYLWDLVKDAEWRSTCFETLGHEAIQGVFSGIMELWGRRTDAKDADVSHWFADGAERSTQDANRRSMFFGLTIVASAVTGTVSAVRRLRSGPAGGVLPKDVSDWASRAEAMLSTAPPLLAARLRDILSSLRNA